MGFRNPQDPYGGLIPPIDRSIGSAYHNVEMVARHLREITYLSDHLDQLQPRDTEFQVSYYEQAFQWRYVPNKKHPNEQWRNLFTLDDLADRLGASFHTVTDLIQNAQKLREGQIVTLLGYRTTADGGAASYKIVKGEGSKYSIKLNDEYSAEHLFGSTINFRQLGISRRDNLEEFYDIMNDFPDHTFVVPNLDLVWNEAGHKIPLTTRGKYRILGEDGAVVKFANLTDKTVGDKAFINIHAPMIGGDQESLSQSQWKTKGIKLTRRSEIGSRKITVQEIPEGVQVGDWISINVTRASEGESRSIGYEAQTNQIVAIDDDHTITLRDPCFYDYEVGKQITGSVTADGTTSGSNKDLSRYYVYVPVKFDNYTINDNTSLRNIEASITFNGKNKSLVNQYNPETGEMYFFWHAPSTVPKKGEKFVIELDSYVTFRPNVQVEQANIRYSLNINGSSRTSNKTGQSCINLLGITNPKTSNVSFDKFGAIPLKYSGHYRGWVRDCVFDGHGKQAYSFDSHGFMEDGGNGLDFSGNVLYCYGQAINLQGYQMTCTFSRIHHNTYTGGGFNYDGTEIAPTEDNKSDGYSSCFVCSHGGVAWASYTDNLAINVEDAFGNFRGREETVRGNIVQGQCDFFAFAMRNAGLTIEDNYYYGLDSNMGETESYTGKGMHLTNFVNYKITFGANYKENAQRHPTIVRNNYASGIVDDFVKILVGDTGKTILRSATIEGNRVGTLIPGVDSVYHFVDSTKNLQVLDCFFGDNIILNRRNAGENFVSVGNFNANNIYPSSGEYLRISDKQFYVCLNKDSVAMIPLDHIHVYSAIVDLYAQTSPNYFASGCLLRATGTSNDKFFQAGTAYNVAPAKELPTGKTGDGNTVSIYLTSNQDQTPKLYVENRRGGMERMILSVR